MELFDSFCYFNIIIDEYQIFVILIIYTISNPFIFHEETISSR